LGQMLLCSGLAAGLCEVCPVNNDNSTRDY
jgi:hypothetical protein